MGSLLSWLLPSTSSQSAINQRIRLQFQTPPRCVPRYPQHVRTKYGYNFVWRIQWLLFMIGCSSNSIYHCCSTQSVVIRERIYSISSRRTPARAPLRTASWHLLFYGVVPLNDRQLLTYQHLRRLMHSALTNPSIFGWHLRRNVSWWYNTITTAVLAHIHPGICAIIIHLSKWQKASWHLLDYELHYFAKQNTGRWPHSVYYCFCFTSQLTSGNNPK